MRKISYPRETGGTKKGINLLLSALLMLMGVSTAWADDTSKAYVSVQQNDEKIDKLGTAAFDISSSPTVVFVDGKAVMTMGDNTVAKLPMSDKGQLVVEFKTTMQESELNKVTKTYTNEFATIYSPFQLTVPSGSVEVYAPTYDSSAQELECTSTTKISDDAVIPVETGLLLKNAGAIDFAISAGASTVTPASALSGSSLLIDKPTVESGNTLYTLGHETNDASKYGFFSYTGTTLAAGLAYLEAPTFSEAKYVHFNFDDDAPAAVNSISNDRSHSSFNAGKYIENCRVVIVKGNKKYNLNGQTLY